MMSKYVLMRDKNILLSKIHKINYDFKGFPFQNLSFQEHKLSYKRYKFNVKQSDSNKKTVIT
jgi:hypothetical protein